LLIAERFLDGEAEALADEARAAGT